MSLIIYKRHTYCKRRPICLATRGNGAFFLQLNYRLEFEDRSCNVTRSTSKFTLPRWNIWAVYFRFRLKTLDFTYKNSVPILLSGTDVSWSEKWINQKDRRATSLTLLPCLEQPMVTSCMISWEAVQSPVCIPLLSILIVGIHVQEQAHLLKEACIFICTVVMGLSSTIRWPYHKLIMLLTILNRYGALKGGRLFIAYVTRWAKTQHFPQILNSS